ncbi:MAG: nucleotide exchange factor GrpE [Candidatus Margulisbacteria bacterium]|nr:nucleotide exchange factor GrpE [Candidatus Margulisiibacteriota bacterium]
MTEHKKEEQRQQHKEAQPVGENPAEKESAAVKAEPQRIKIEDLKAQENQSAVDGKKAAELAEKLKTAEDKYLRLYAEFDNFRKRAETEKTEHTKYAAGKFIEAVLPVLDSFERSQKTLNVDARAGEEVKKGFALIHKQLEDVLRKFGVTKMTAVGQLFDPRFHEAALQKESDQPSQTVLEELQTGYVMYDKVLRPAMVVVAR